VRLSPTGSLFAGPHREHAVVLVVTNAPEPWLRGPLAGVHPVLAPVFFSFQQVREDLARHTSDLTEEQLWRVTPAGVLGFHLKHLAGSVDRISTYLVGDQLNQEQLKFLSSESTAGESLKDLLALIDAQLSNSERKLFAVDPQQLYEPRGVGRQRLPSTVVGLIVHLAEHTQRHLGQIIVLSKLLRPGS
jgi:uncharacterized damage-inducible protein DinB